MSKNEVITALHDAIPRIPTSELKGAPRIAPRIEPRTKKPASAPTKRLTDYKLNKQGEVDFWFDGVKKPVTAVVAATFNLTVDWEGVSGSATKSKFVKLSQVVITDDGRVLGQTGWDAKELKAYALKSADFKKTISEEILKAIKSALDH